MNKIYFDKYRLIEMENGGYAIANLNGDILYDVKNQGFRTKQRAIHFLTSVLSFINAENKFADIIQW
jgi:hypothetical protein